MRVEIVSAELQLRHVLHAEDRRRRQHLRPVRSFVRDRSQGGHQIQVERKCAVRLSFQLLQRRLRR